jgi:GNAT superfamily N-acetyltransferase
VELRPTTDGDLPAMHETFLAAVRSVYDPLNLPAPGPPLEVFSNLHSHIARTGTSVVAERAGRIDGFAAAWTRDDDWFLASLFVAPHAQGAGLGSRLLDAVWGEAARRRTMTDAVQPVSNALYGRRGLLPVTPVLWFTGTPTLDEPAEESDADLAEIDAAAYGFDRAVDHGHWGRFAGRSTWGDAYSYVFRGDIGPVAGRTSKAASRALAAELSRAPGSVRVRVLGSSRELVEVALRARLRLGNTPGFLLLSPGLEAPTALAPSGYALY